MIRSSRVRTVATFEFKTTVFRAGFLIATFLLPILLALISGGTTALQGMLIAERLVAAQKWAVVDDTGLFTHSAEDSESKLTKCASMNEALRLLHQESVASIIRVPQDWKSTGRLLVYVSETHSPFDPPPNPPGLLKRILLTQLLSHNVDEMTRARVLDPFAPEVWIVQAQSIERESPNRAMKATLHMIFPIIFSILFITALFTTSGYLVQTIANDKQTRVAEILLSSVTAEEILAGKLIGLGAAGLVQLFVWILFSGAGVVIAGTHALLPEAIVSWQSLVLAPFLFTLGYFFLGSLVLITGSFGTSAAESQKLSVLWTLLGILPMFVLVSFLDDPQGILPRILTFFPPSAALSMLLRISIDVHSIAVWEIVIASFELIFATWAVLHYGSRLFSGALLHNTLPKMRDLFLWMRTRS